MSIIIYEYCVGWEGNLLLGNVLTDLCMIMVTIWPKYKV